MTVISISITESTQQIISGIPRTITVSTNIPATIFYTLDGKDPTTDSSIYIGPVTLPTNNSSVTFKVFATNGLNSSPIIDKFYAPTITNDRRPHDTVIGLTSGPGVQDTFPFGDNGPLNPVTYGNTGGIVVDNPSIPNIPDGYDGTATGTYADGTDLPLTSYQFIYSTSNSLGETGRGIGTLPSITTILVPKPMSPSSSSKASDKFFNPKAMVIYQDSREMPYDDVSQLNRGIFSLQNAERSRNGALLLNTAFDSSSPTGSFLRSHYNQRENTITYYYRDSDTGRWIISVEPYQPKNSNIGSLYKMVLPSRQQGIGFVWKWIPFMSRKLI